MQKLISLFNTPKVQAVFLMGIRGISLVAKFILTLFIARYMGFEDLGLYGLIIATGFMIPAITGLGIAYIKVRESVTASQYDIVKMIYEIGRYYKWLYIGLMVITVCVGLIEGHTALALLILGVVFFEHINSDLYTLLLNLSKPLLANVLHFIRSAVWIFVFIVFAFFIPELREIEVLAFAWMVGGALAFVGFFLSTKDWPWSGYSSDKVKEQALIPWVKSEFKESKVVYKNHLTDATVYNFNQYIITFFLGIELAGVYVYFNQIITAMCNLIRTGIIFNARPKIVRAIKDGQEEALTIFKKCRINTMVLTAAMGILSAPALYMLTYYMVDKPMALEWFPLYGVALIYFVALLMIEVDQIVLYAKHQDKKIFRLSLINLIALVVLNIILLPFISLWGAFISLFLASSLRFFVQLKEIKAFQQSQSLV